MALNANALTTVANLKAWLNDSSSANDAKYEMLINSVSQTINKYLGRNIKQAAYVEKYEGVNDQNLMLNQYPIVSVAYVKIDGGSLEVDDYIIEKEKGWLYKATGWLKTGYSTWLSGRVDMPEKSIEVSYTAGYAEIPSDLEMTCIEICMNKLSLTESQGRTLSSYSISDISMVWGVSNRLKEFTPDQIMVLNQYRKRRF